MQESGDQPVQDAGPQEQSPSLGTQLRKAREAKELGLEKIADELRIEPSVLRALEEDRLGDIPVAPVFIKGYIKQYGRQLGLRYADLRAAYLAQIGNDEVTLLPSQPIALRDERQITLWIIAALVLMLVAVFLFVWWVGDEGAGAPDAAAPTPPAAPVRTQTRAAPAAPPPAAVEPPGVAPGADAADPLASPSPAPGAGPGGAALPGAAAPSPSPAPGAAATPVPTAPLAVTRSASVGVVAEPGARIMTVRFRDESWVEITAAGDRRVYYDLGAAGTELTFAVQPPVRVLLGNAEGVDIIVDDVPYAIPQQGRRGNVANFVIPAATD